MQLKRSSKQRVLGPLTLAGTIMLAACASSTPIRSAATDSTVSTPAPEVLAEPAAWSVAGELDHNSRTLPILVQERTCASGQSAEGRIKVEVVEVPHQIRLRVSVTPLDGAQSCGDNPTTGYAVRLDAPIDRRHIINEWTEEVLATPTPVPDAWELARSPTAVPMAIPPSTFFTDIPPLADGVVSSYTEDPAFDVPLEIRCPLSQDRESWWPPTGTVEYMTPEDVLSVAIAENDLRPEGFHHFAEQPPGAIARNVFIQFSEGKPATIVVATGRTIGFHPTGEWCVGQPDGWVPDPNAPE